MSNTNRESYPSTSEPSTYGATKNDVLRLAMSEMATGIKIPKSVAWRLYDSKRGRIAQPLGSYPEVAEACIDANGSFFHIARPLNVMLAHLRRRCVGKMSRDLRAALCAVQKEDSEAEACALTLALSVERPGVSDLLSFDREASEAELALAKAREIVADKIAELEAK